MRGRACVRGVKYALSCCTRQLHCTKLEPVCCARQATCVQLDAMPHGTCCVLAANNDQVEVGGDVVELFTSLFSACGVHS
jgi:hypothetical protein